MLHHTILCCLLQASHFVSAATWCFCDAMDCRIGVVLHMVCAETNPEATEFIDNLLLLCRQPLVRQRL